MQLPKQHLKKSGSLLGAFTLIEVIVALAIVSLALMTLMRLHLTSGSLINRSSQQTQAVLLAQEKLSLISATGFPKPQTTSGTVKRNLQKFHWQIQVREVSLPEISSSGKGLREVIVRVSWRDGQNEKQLHMTSYVADRRIL